MTFKFMNEYLVSILQFPLIWKEIMLNTYFYHVSELLVPSGYQLQLVESSDYEFESAMIVLLKFLSIHG